ncbi:MAG: SRPBCC domain-containing protein [Acidobacteria bacterium]|nr:SRPBCC domain-containing protein [Acidobacteriota bacterium]
MADLHHYIQIDVPAAKVYDAVATQKGMRGWWTADSHLEERVGGKAEFGFDNRAMVFRMAIDALEPGKLVRMTCAGDHPEWAGTHLEWRITEEGGKSAVSFIHRDWRESTPFYASCNSTWGELMYRLKAYVESGKPAPHWTS